MTKENISEEQVIEYLKTHPEFFMRNKSILDNVHIQHEHKGTISLVEIQLMRQREQIVELEEKLSRLRDISQYNEQIFFSLFPLQQQLVGAKNIQQGENILNVWAQTLGLKKASILLLKDSWPANDIVKQEMWIDRTAFEVIRLERFGLRDFYLGQLYNREKSLIFAPQEWPVGSVALCLLKKRENKTRYDAVLAFSAHDGSRFNSQQDITFLEQLKGLLEKHLVRWLQENN